MNKVNMSLWIKYRPILSYACKMFMKAFLKFLF